MLQTYTYSNLSTYKNYARISECKKVSEVYLVNVIHRYSKTTKNFALCFSLVIYNKEPDYLY